MLNGMRVRISPWAPFKGFYLKRERSLIGKTPVSKTGIGGSIPSAPAIRLKRLKRLKQLNGDVYGFDWKSEVKEAGRDDNS